MDRKALARLCGEGAVIRVALREVRGSAPRDAGAAMYVGPRGICGTIGGGQLEYMAIDQARRMLADSVATGRMDVPLGPEIGQCCGGHVEVDLALVLDMGAELAGLDAAERALPHVLIFGAGHIGRALARALGPMPCHALLVDSRAEELALAADLPQMRSPLPEAALRAAPQGSAYVILTHDHALDFMLGVEALTRPDAPYIGMIGSATKAARFARYCRAQGQDPARMTCPMGQKTASKDPAVIAAMIVAELWGALEAKQARARADYRAPSRIERAR